MIGWLPEYSKDLSVMMANVPAITSMPEHRMLNAPARHIERKPIVVAISMWKLNKTPLIKVYGKL